jgi:2-dehydro-3-deoxyphosphooctonate aldolase (KDO 8-P synthase)
MVPDSISSSLEGWFATPAARRPLLVIAGPCALESDAVNLEIGQTVRDACRGLGLPFVFKASFDKANRSSIASARGPGLSNGLERLAALRAKLGVPVTTDIHEASQAAAAAEAVDLLQVPAFLCRQTDLLVAAAATGKPVNVKKGQFLAPADLRHVLAKLAEGGARRAMLTERGTFFGYHRLVNDFIGLGDLAEMAAHHPGLPGTPVCFDVTHSTQLPGADGNATGGRPDRAAPLARAAVAAGVDAIFLECHPRPRESLSDASTMQPLAAMPELLESLVRIRRAAGFA